MHKSNHPTVRRDAVRENSTKLLGKTRELINRETVVVVLFCRRAHGSDNWRLEHVDVLVDVEQIPVEHELVHDSVKA